MNPWLSETDKAVYVRICVIRNRWVRMSRVPDEVETLVALQHTADHDLADLAAIADAHPRRARIAGALSARIRAWGRVPASDAAAPGEMDAIERLANGRPIITAEQCRAARALLNWTLEETVKRSGVSKPAISQFENARNEWVQDGTAWQLLMTFAAAGIVFDVTDDAIGVRLLRETR